MLAPRLENNTPNLKVQDLGLLSYKHARRLQKRLQEKRILGEIADTLILCEHPSVITLGKKSAIQNILVNQDFLERRGIEVVETERGGNVTWHGPGQLVAYPILDLKNYKKDVHWYMRKLEEVVIETLKTFNISGVRIPKQTGVWINNQKQLKKIASLGIRISRWVTMHGIALNVKDSLDGFALINPCGYKDIKMTSIEVESSSSISLDSVKEIFIKSFMESFQVNKLNLKNEI